MNRCEKKGCGSYAFNLHRRSIAIDQGHLCDVHYWQNKAETARRDTLEEAANKHEAVARHIPVDSPRYLFAVEVSRELRRMARLFSEVES